jgi:uncharacterized damage-inducible protein DinB
MVVDAIKSEYKKYYTLIELAVDQISDDNIHKIFGNDGNSIAIIIRHISGNLKSRFTNFLTEDGEKTWRNRDTEFESTNESKLTLMTELEKSFKIVYNELGNLSDDNLNRTISIRGKALTVIEALERSLAHTAYHTGQVVLMAKFYAGENWKTLSIPKGKSEEYNKNPIKEKKPSKQ